LIKRLRYGVKKADENIVYGLKTVFELLGVEYKDFVKCRPYIYRLGSLGILSCSEYGAKYFNASIIYSGEWLGIIINNKIYLSTVIYERVYRYLGEYRAAITVSQHGVKTFLYGNDLFASSIIKYYEPMYNPVAVIDSFDNRVIGVAEPMVSENELINALKKGLERPVYKNVYDLGFFIRYFE